MDAESFRERLRRVRREPQPATRPAAEGSLTLGSPAELALAAGVQARTRRFEAEHRHGAGPLAEIESAESAACALCARDPALAGLDLSQALFLDTETTGLSGGAGTYVFLVGLGRFVAGRFELWQGFLDEPAHEEGLLREVAERLRAAPLLVTFFGKAFDRHRLEDKMRLHGIEPPFSGRAHLDLFHPLRRLYAGSYADTRLRTLEQALCGIERADDLPGSFAPAAWFDFLAGRAHRLEGVFEHNQDDVLSLVSLAAHLGRVTHGQHADGRALGGDAHARTLGLARLRAEERDFAGALELIEGAGHASREAQLLRVELLARLARRAEALEQLARARSAPEDAFSAPFAIVQLRLAPTTGEARAPEESRLRALLDRTLTGRAHARWSRELERLRARRQR